ncbi:YidH family protein [Rhodococcus sp. NPDC056960]|uniref:YidH family protein n=1 Tax=Rhodococcus sp. NPDC056960 TaxID=3345982 RepID=UPI00362899FF
MTWRPKSFRLGADPDPRFTLANERTFLAWIRTALGTVAAAVGFEAFGADVVGAGVRSTVVVFLLVGAIFLAVGAFRRWCTVEGALRLGKGLPVPTVAVLATGLVVGTSLTLLVVAATR